MPMALVRDVQARCEAGTLPAWMARLQEDRRLSCEALGEAVASIIENAKKNVDLETWEAIAAFDEHESFRVYVDTYTVPDVEIFSAGEWNGDEYTVADLREMVEAFNQVGFDPPLKLGHSKEQKLAQEDGLPSVGWVSKLAEIGGKLVATFSGVPKKVAELIRLGGYKQRSAEIYWNFRDSLNDRSWRRVLKAVSLIGADVPAVKGMPGLSTLDAYLELYCHGESQDEGEVHVAGVNFTEDTEVSGDADTKPTTPATPPDQSSAVKAMAEELASMKVRMEELGSENKGLRERLDVQAARGQAEAVEYFIATAKKAGKLAPSEEPGMKRLASTLDQNQVHKFTDGDNTVEKTQWELFKEAVEGRESAFTPQGGDGESDPDGDRKSVEPGAKATVKYAQHEFDTGAYEKAYAEATKAGVSPSDAYTYAKAKGWGKDVSLPASSKGGES